MLIDVIEYVKVAEMSRDTQHQLRTLLSRTSTQPTDAVKRLDKVKCLIEKHIALNTDHIIKLSPITLSYESTYAADNAYSTASSSVVPELEVKALQANMIGNSVIYIKGESIDELKMQLALNGQKLG